MDKHHTKDSKSYHKDDDDYHPRDRYRRRDRDIHHHHHHHHRKEQDEKDYLKRSREGDRRQHNDDVDSDSYNYECKREYHHERKAILDKHIEKEDYQDKREKRDRRRDRSKCPKTEFKSIEKSEEWGKKKEEQEKKEESKSSTSKENNTQPKQKPDLGLSGALAAEQNTVNGVVLKYSEPPEARKFNKSSRLYIFKGKEQVDLLHVHRQSAYLIGRDRTIADIPIDHPSCSKQHAVLQYRQTVKRNEMGQMERDIKPYIIDLGSTNGTFLNTVRIEPSTYYELKQGDVLKFGESTREYVFLIEED